MPKPFRNPRMDPNSFLTPSTPLTKRLQRLRDLAQPKYLALFSSKISDALFLFSRIHFTICLTHVRLPFHLQQLGLLQEMEKISLTCDHMDLHHQNLERIGSVDGKSFTEM